MVSKRLSSQAEIIVEKWEGLENEKTSAEDQPMVADQALSLHLEKLGPKTLLNMPQLLYHNEHKSHVTNIDRFKCFPNGTRRRAASDFSETICSNSDRVGQCSKPIWIYIYMYIYNIYIYI